MRCPWVEGQHELYGFLTTEPNAVVAPIHPKAMPVILTTSEECEVWLTGAVPEALKLHRPLSGGQLRLVVTGQKMIAAHSLRTISRPSDVGLG